ncbi:hypothetical protein DL96DRAFT_1655380 [Flagelloscypha sp. PMI_526]|nr:hypothetical protein DL96DRAFT_1655380 [Flagelloscypha sp. PMI_526]
MLPPELIRPILSFLDPKSGEDALALRACCLVASKFLPEAQPRLFSSVTLQSHFIPTGIYRFRDLLVQSPHIGPWVISLTMTATYWELEGEVLKSLTSLRSLEYCDLGFRWPVIPDATRQVLREIIIPRLHNLSVDFLDPSLVPRNSFASLRMKNRRSIRHLWPVQVPHAFKLKVTHMALLGDMQYWFESSSTDQLIISKFIDYGSIKSVQLDTESFPRQQGQALSCYRILLQTIGMNLTNLAWGSIILSTTLCISVQNYDFQFLRLDFFPNLEQLLVELPRDRSLRETCLSRIIDHSQVSTLHPLMLLYVTFQPDHISMVPLRPDWQNKAWGKLDRFIQQDEFFQLQRLTIGFPSPPDSRVRQSVQKALPEAFGKTILHLCEI